MKRNQKIIIYLSIVSLVTIFFGISLGSAEINMNDLWETIFSKTNGKYTSIIFELRVPRVLTAFAVGGLLAISGVLMQVLLRNPLAEPYILGSSGGAAVAALLAMSFGFGSFWITNSYLTCFHNSQWKWELGSHSTSTDRCCSCIRIQRYHNIDSRLK